MPLCSFDIFCLFKYFNCNAGAVTTNKRGTYRNLKVWYLPDGIANIISMNELESLYRITYDSWEGYYVVHTPKGEVRFYKDEQGLPYLDLDEYDAAGTMLLLQREETAGGKVTQEMYNRLDAKIETIINANDLKRKK